MSLFQKNIISTHVIKAKSNKLMKRALRDAKKQIRKGVLGDSRHLSMYLQMIDERFTYVKDEINNAKRVHNYTNVYAVKMADTRQMLASYNQGYAELNRLSRVADKKAKSAGRPDDFIHEKLSALDITELQNKFDALIREENDNDTTKK